MPSFARSAPHLVLASRRVLDLIEGILDVRLERRARFDVLLHHGIAGIHASTGSIFRSSHHSRNSSNPMPSEDGSAMGWMGGPVHQRTDVFFHSKRSEMWSPQDNCRPASAETLDASRQLLHDVDAVAVGTVMIGRRKKRNQAEPDRCRARMVRIR